MITSSRRPSTVMAARGLAAAEVPGVEHRPDRRRDGRARHEDLAGLVEAHARAEERRAVRQRPASTPRSARRSGRPGRPPRAARSSRACRDRGAAEQHPAQRGRLAQPGVEQAGERRGDERDERRPRRVAQRVEDALRVEALVEDRGRRRRSPSAGGSSRPPTCASGRQQSQRSRGSDPSATAEPSALHSQLPYVSVTGRAAALVPDVWTTAARRVEVVGRRSGAAGSCGPPSGPSTVSAHDGAAPRDLRGGRAAGRAGRPPRRAAGSRGARRRTPRRRAARSRRVPGAHAPRRQHAGGRAGPRRAAPRT